MTKQINVFQTKDLFLVDTPGLSDTQGPLYDLSNTIALEKALHNSASVRMLFIIKESSIFSD